MMTTQEVLNSYRTLATLTEQMLAAAQAGDWDQLVVLEQHAASQVRRLQQHEPQAPLAGAEREQKVALIRQMLLADRQIRDLTMPWMAQLSALISSTGAERRLANAYGGV